MNTESSAKGISIRAWLALWAVVSGTTFLYVLALVVVVAAILGWIELDPAMQLIILVATNVIGFVMLALGYYLGQKSVSPPAEPQE